jgi:hypothetical protein
MSVNKMVINMERNKHTGFYPVINWSRQKGCKNVIIRFLFHHFVYPAGKPMIPYFLCYQGLAVDDYGFALDASDLGHPRLSLIKGKIEI